MTPRDLDNMIDIIDAIIGDTPVAEQLDTAVRDLAPKSHKHENYVSREEFEVLQAQVNKLLELVGDTPVSEQIISAIQNM